MLAKIVRSSKRVFDCRLASSGEIVTATSMREIIKKNHLVVGDNIELQKNSTSLDYEITQMHERTNEVFRKIVRTNQKKVIASNVDVVLIVCSVSKPDYKPGLIDRYLTRTVQWDIPAAIVLTKMDEWDDQFDLEFEMAKFKQLGVEYFFINAADAHDARFRESFLNLQNKLKNKTAICLGQSGVGKSKLISALSNGKVELLSNRLAKKVEKGSHTTTWAEIVDCDEFLMIDSPGVRTLSMQDLSIDELPDLFPDLAEYFPKCQFKDCKHYENIKGCYFHKLDPSELESAIILARLQSYIKMREEVEAIPEWDKN
jgi:ribosome biogenesis GTPase / thiamine phosphate phosphatase